MKPGIVALALVAVACRTDGTSPDLADLDMLPTPQSNTAVVMLAQNVADGAAVVPAGELIFYDLVPGSIPHALTFDQRDAEAGHFLVVISELYQAGVVTTNGINNLLAWTSPGGTEFRPVTSCELDVLQPFVFGLESEMIVHSVCTVRATNGRTVTVLAKANRHQQGLGGQ